MRVTIYAEFAKAFRSEQIVSIETNLYICLNSFEGRYLFCKVEDS